MTDQDLAAIIRDSVKDVADSERDSNGEMELPAGERETAPSQEESPAGERETAPTQEESSKSTEYNSGFPVQVLKVSPVGSNKVGLVFMVYDSWSLP